MIRRQLIDAFKKEIFGLAAMRMRDNGEKTEENERILHNIVKDTVKKWQKLCEMFEKYNETKGILKVDDLMMEDEELFEGINRNSNLPADDGDTDGDRINLAQETSAILKGNHLSGKQKY